MPVETDNRFKAILLTDLSRLQEIFELRVIAWSDKEGSKINSHSHPKGWSDSLDPISLHWVIENENKDHSHDNENLNELFCGNDAQNLKNVEQTDVFLSNDTG